MIATTGHDINAATDYALLREQGIGTVRDAVRWHLIEIVPGQYDWSSLDSQLAAAERGNMQVIWDAMITAGRTISTSGPLLWWIGSRGLQPQRPTTSHRERRVPLCSAPVPISFLAWAGGMRDI